MQLGVDLVRLARKYPLIILVTGDTDLRYAIHIAKEEGRSDTWVVVVIPGIQRSRKLIDIADWTVRITDSDISAAGGSELAM